MVLVACLVGQEVICISLLMADGFMPKLNCCSPDEVMMAKKAVGGSWSTRMEWSIPATQQCHQLGIWEHAYIEQRWVFMGQRRAQDDCRLVRAVLCPAVLFLSRLNSASSI